MTTEIVAQVARILTAAAKSHAGVDPPPDAVLELVADRLPDLLASVAGRIIVAREAAAVITARFVDWLEKHAGRQIDGSHARWEDVIAEIEPIVHAG